MNVLNHHLFPFCCCRRRRRSRRHLLQLKTCSVLVRPGDVVPLLKWNQSYIFFKNTFMGHFKCWGQTTDMIFWLWNLSYTKDRACVQMLLICVIMECPTLIEEKSVPLRKSGLLKCHSCFRRLSFKRQDFSPSSSICLSSPLVTFFLFALQFPLFVLSLWRL